MGIGRTQVLAEHTPAFVRGMAAGIEHLHVRDIIHRDIKPENIFVCADFSIRVGDFGQVHGMRQK
jgi:serine/threonine protein kinase